MADTNQGPNSIGSDLMRVVVATLLNSNRFVRIAALVVLAVQSTFLMGDGLAKFTVHGRLYCANGAPSTRIWIVGTHRVLGVQEWQEGATVETPQMPPELSRLLNFNREIYGDFTVIPSTPFRKGWMQFVSIESAENLVVMENGKLLKRIKRVE